MQLPTLCAEVFFTTNSKFICLEVNCITIKNYQSFIYSPVDALVNCLKNNIKIYIKAYIRTAPTCYGVTVTPSSGAH